MFMFIQKFRGADCFKVLFRRFLRVFSDFLWFFKVFFGFSFLKTNNNKKGHGFFCQSEIHLARYNLRKCPLEIHLARYNLSFNPRYTLLGIISKLIRDTPC